MNRVKNFVFLVRKWSYTTFNTVNIRKMREKKGKIRRTRLMTKKRSSEIFTLKMEIFPEIGPQKIFWPPPQIRRQVSAHATASGKEYGWNDDFLLNLCNCCPVGYVYEPKFGMLR